MHKLIVLYKNPPDLDHFRQHYENIHLPLVRRVPGVVEATVTFTPGNGQGGASPYAAIGETLFATTEHMLNSLKTPEGQALIADAANYAGTEFEMIDFVIPNAS